MKIDGTFLEKGQTATIVTDEVVGNTERFTVSYKDLYKDLKAGDIILLDDGYVSVEVKEISGTDIIVNVLNTGRMKSRRGVNVPGVTLSFEFMSAKDRADIEWACDQDLDFIAASFVRNANDLKEIKAVLAESGNTARVISRLKPQTPILALTSNEKTRRSLALSYGVQVEMIERQERTTVMMADAVEIAKAKGLVVTGDEVAISAGSINEEGKTDLMRIVTVKKL